MATATFYADPGNPGTTSVDGNMTIEAAASYAIAHGAATASEIDRDGIGFLEVINSTFGTFYIGRNQVNFDTSTLGAGATITSATLSIYVDSVPSNADSDSVSIVLNTITSNVAYATSDFANYGTTKQATDIALSSLTSSAYNNFTLNATGIGNISKTGITKFGVRSAGDVANSQPTGNNFVKFVSADAAGGQSTAPKLVVTYTTGNTGGFLAFM